MSKETESQEAGTYENKADASKTERDTVKRRLRAIELASTEEKEWRADVEEAEKLYRAETEAKGKGGNFNIYFSNIETLIPSLYNSTPVPDIRRRFGDADPVAKMGADILERSISQSVDEYDFDGTMEAIIQDLGIASRGIARVVYDVGLGDVNGTEDVTYQSVACQHVPWNMFRRGPASHWDKVPWIAFAHYLGREELTKLSPKYGPKVNLDLTLESTSDQKGREPEKPEADVFKRTLVWEIWDKDEKAVIFIAPSHPEHHLKIVPDPLGLKGFFPIPRPVMGSKTSGKLIPICEYRIYKDLLKELDDLTTRIRKLVKQLRPRVLVGAPAEAEADIERFAKADDSDVIFASKAMAFLDAGGLEKMLAWWPMEPIVKAIQALYERRDGVKQDIYEVVGLSDIMRGSVNPNEKLGQSEIKSQWGSLRTGRKQKDVQRFIRDLFRLKCEIICKHFEPQTLAMITGIDPNQAGAPQAGPPGPDGQPQMVPGPPIFPQAIQLLKQDAQRAYRIDIETDSTIRGDVSRNMEQMTQFVQGSGAFFQNIAPAVELGVLSKEAAITIYSAFARQLRLGREAEDTLDRLGQQAKQPEPPKPDPEAMKLQAEQQKMQMQMQMEEKKLQMEMPLKQADLQLKGMDLEIKKVEIGAKQQDMAMAQQTAQQDAQFRTQEMDMKKGESLRNMEMQDREHQFKTETSNRDFDLRERDMAAKNAQGEREFSLKEKRDAFERGIKQVETLGAEENAAPLAGLIDTMTKTFEQLLQSQQQQNEMLTKALTADKQIVFDKNGRPVGSKTVMN